MISSFETRRTGGKLEVYHFVHGWVRVVKVNSDSIKITRWSNSDGAPITYNEDASQFKPSGLA